MRQAQHQRLGGDSHAARHHHDRAEDRHDLVEGRQDEVLSPCERRHFHGPYVRVQAVVLVIRDVRDLWHQVLVGLVRDKQVFVLF